MTFDVTNPGDPEKVVIAGNAAPSMCGSILAFDGAALYGKSAFEAAGVSFDPADDEVFVRNGQGDLKEEDLTAIALDTVLSSSR